MATFTTGRIAMFRDALDWFEIPLEPLEAAQRFYEALLDIVGSPAPLPVAAAAAHGRDERPCRANSALARS